MQTDLPAPGCRTSLPVILPWASLCVLFMLLYFRNAGLYPLVFTDEWVYSKGARLTPLADATAPSYLYLAIYGITASCGHDFLDCARTLNVLFFVSAVPLVYLVARKVSSRGAATTVAGLSALSPFNSYTAYFMPEAMYFFCFWLFAWYSITYMGSSRGPRHASAGVLVGIISLVKLHAFFLGFGYVVFLLLTELRSRETFSFKRCTLGIVRFVLALVIVRLIVGYALAGQHGLNLTGSDYSPNAEAILSMRDPLRLFAQAIRNLGGHALGLAAMFALPLAILPGLLERADRHDSKRARDEAEDARAVATFTIAILAPLLAITALYTASIAGLGPHESIDRIHARYYSFAFPLLLIAAASQVSPIPAPGTSAITVRITSAFIAGIALAYAMVTRLSSYLPSIVDCPELTGLVKNPTAFYSLTSLGLVSLVIWAYRRDLGARIFLYILMPATVACTSTQTTITMRERILPDAYDRAGIFAHEYLDSQATSKLLVMGPELGYLFRTLFHVDNPQASVQSLAADSKFDLAQIRGDREWLLLVGSHSRIDKAEFEINAPGFRLIKLAIDRKIDFSKAAWPGILTRTSGLSEAESWGTWSNRKVVTLDFTFALPRTFLVRLKANAFGPNIGRPFVLKIGRVQRSFVLTATPREVLVAVDANEDNVRTLEIEVPEPTSPKSLGLSEDSRLLGIALGSLVIDSARQPGGN